MGSLLGETSGTAEIPRERVKSLAPVLEATTTGKSESIIPVLEVVIVVVGMEVPVPVSETSIPLASTETTTPIVDELSMPITDLPVETTSLLKKRQRCWQQFGRLLLLMWELGPR